tara:strand:+ start:353 stop:526 length:174 start_codon:yes stop_codon:yes gene_type:complete
MKYKVTASMDVGFETTIVANSEVEALDLANDLEFHLWKEVSNGSNFEINTLDIEEEV